MIVQCQACQTRFRLADEKIKPGGTKVRCSKCKEIFTVAPPEPEPAEETVDFGEFNMEAVSDETSDDAAAAATTASAAEETAEAQQEPGPEAETAEAPEPTEETQGSEAEGDELDFGSLEEAAGATGAGEELAEEFTFADTSQPAETADMPSEPDASDADESEDGEPGGPVEFDFGEDSTAAGEADTAAKEDSTEEESGGAEFSFDSTADEDTEPAEFSFDEDDDTTTATADEGPADFAFGESGDDDAFSFDDESPADSGGASEWDDESPAGDTFDFDEPQFDSDTTEPDSATRDAAEAGMQFGEIDFSDDEASESAPGFQTDDSFAQATIEPREEPEPFTRREQAPPPSPYDDDEEPLPVPPPPKKSSLSRVLLLLILLLVILAGAAGFMFMQDGSLNLNAVTQYLPFLKDYIGEPQGAAEGERIGINIRGSSYVEGQAGQMLVVQGTAVNKHAGTRSSIIIKGTLIDAQGKSLRQQTVFCGNPLNEAQLARMPFSAIEEAMNNEFGDSLANINIAPGASIPFTIVFRNLPNGIANINVEVVDSKPGGS